MGRKLRKHWNVWLGRRNNPDHDANKRLNFTSSWIRFGLNDDAVQMSAVLRHVAKYCPHWRVDLQAEHGRHCIGRGIVAATFPFGDPYPSPHYDAEVEILLYDTWSNWHDRPNTRVSSCLRERFGLGWDKECSQYRVDVSDSVARWASDVVPPMSVAYHYQGDSSPDKKNLTYQQAEEICKHIRRMGYHPFKMGRHIPKGYDAERNCAIIAQCDAFVGIDSGPSKCASATDTPALVVWTGHHPAPFHDPAPNTTHLVPCGYHGMHPVCDNPGVIKFFEANYSVRYYDRDPVSEIRRWLCDTLK